MYLSPWDKQVGASPWRLLPSLLYTAFWSCAYWSWWTFSQHAWGGVGVLIYLKQGEFAWNGVITLRNHRISEFSSTCQQTWQLHGSWQMHVIPGSETKEFHFLASQKVQVFLPLFPQDCDKGMDDPCSSGAWSLRITCLWRRHNPYLTRYLL